MAKQNKRKAIVFFSLIGSLSVTTTLLLALAPAPLTPGAAATLFNANTVQSPLADMGSVYRTDRPIVAGAWTDIIVRRDRGISTDGPSLADHFVIGNGINGGADGEIRIAARWMSQTPASSIRGAGSDRCISICVAGDVGGVTILQNQRLEQLLASLKQQLGINADRVQVSTQPPTIAAIPAR